MFNSIWNNRINQHYGEDDSESLSEVELRAITFEKWLNHSQGGSSTTGVPVTDHTVLTFGAFMACVRVITETIASLPINVIEKRGSVREPATGTDVFKLLRFEPNGYQTPYAFFYQLVMSTVLKGNGYAEIVRGSNGRIIALYNIPPDSVRIQLKNGYIPQYEVLRNVRGSNEWVPMDHESLLHLKMFTLDGYNGVSPLTYAKEALGLGLAAQSFAANSFKNAFGSNLVIQPDGALPQQAEWDAFVEQSDAELAGAKNAGRAMHLPHGFSITQLKISHEDYQLLEQRQFQTRDVARIMRIPPHMIGDLADAKYSNLSQENLHFIQHTLRPWLTQIEQELSRKLLPFEKRKVYQIRYDLDDLLRGDPEAMSKWIATIRQQGVLNTDEIREMLGYGSVDGGEHILIQVNMTSLEKVTSGENLKSVDIDNNAVDDDSEE